MPFSKHITTLLVSILGFNIYFSNIITLSQSMLPTGSFFVSEINWNGSWVKDTVTNQFKSSSDDEWIEFYNSSDKTISLNDFNIKGFSSSNKDLSYKNNSKCIILPKSYFVVSRLDSSPTVDNSTGCVAANMSISNTNINYSITDKVSQTIDSGLIGDPNKITLSKNTFKKFSIYKDGSNWLESNQSVNITQKIDPDLNYQHYASPGGNISKIDLNLPSILKSQVTPFKLDYSLSFVDKEQKWSLFKTEVTIFKTICSVKSQSLSDLFISETHKYCLRVKYELKNGLKLYNGFIDRNFEFILETQNSPKLPSLNLMITELDLNKDQVEIFNSGDTDVDLSDFYLQDTEGTAKKSKMVGWIIKSKNFSVFNTKTIGITLNNDGDNLEITDINNLKLTSSSIVSIKKTQVKDESWQYFEDTKTWEEYLSTLGRQNQRIQKDLEPELGLKKKEPAKNTLESQALSYFQDKLLINEIYPEGEEFVELYNQSDQELNLEGLKLVDSQGKIGSLTLEQGSKIMPKSYLKINLKSKISLNNGGDGIYLLTSTDQEIDSVSYLKSQGVDKSFQRFENDWFWAQTSPEKENTKELESLKKVDESIKSPKNSTLKTEILEDKCTQLEIYTQISKNVFYSNQGKISIKNTTKQNLPASIQVCNLKTQEEQSTANFKEWENELQLSDIQVLTDSKSPENLKFVKFNLACKGKKNADIVRGDIIFRSVLGVKKPGCINKTVSGTGFVLKTKEGYILYYVGLKIQSSQVQTLIRTGGQDSFSLYFRLLDNFQDWLNVYMQ